METFGTNKDENSNSSGEPETILGLPQNLQFEIFSYMDIRTHIQLRATNKSFTEANDQYWRSELKKEISRAEKGEPESQKSVLMVVKLATEIYVENGFESTFYDCLLHEMENGPGKLNGFTEAQIPNFLLHFYSVVEKKIGKENRKYSNSLYVLSFLYALKYFANSSRSFELGSYGLSGCIKVKNIWFGGIFELVTTKKLPYLLVALSEILTAQFLKRTSAYVKTHEDYRLIYGYECSKRRRSPAAIFDFFIDGSEIWLRYLRFWLKSTETIVHFPKKMLQEGFGFMLKTQVKTTIKYGWPQIIYMQLVHNEEQAEVFSD